MPYSCPGSRTASSPSVDRAPTKKSPRNAAFSTWGSRVPRLHLSITWVHEGRRKGSQFIGELIDSKKPLGGRKKDREPLVETVAASTGLEVSLSGGFSGEIVKVEEDGALVSITGGGDMFVAFGERVTVGDKTLPLGPEGTSEADDDVFLALKEWRKQRAKDDDVPAYIIFHDSTLREIVAAKPADLDELGAISGVGPTKLERYGTDVLRVIEKAS